MTGESQAAFLGDELNRIAALLRLASHRCGHEVEMSFDPELVAVVKSAACVAWERDGLEADAGPQFRAAAPVICDGRCVCALATTGVGAPDEWVAETLADAALAAGRLIRPLTWRMLQENAGPAVASEAA